MAVQIKLHDRSALPPGRTGAVKPPTQLADRSGEAALGQGLAKFGGDSFNRLEQTRVANEEAIFQGTVNDAMGEFDVFVASNPGASFQQLETERDKMLKGIRIAGNSSTMPRAKESNARWYKKNLGSIRFQTQASMEAIQSKQQLATYNQLQENNIKSLSIDGKAKYNTNMENAISSGLVDEGSARAKQTEDYAIFDAAQSKVTVANVSGIGFNAWEATITEDNPDGDLNAGFDAINAIEGISGDQKQDSESAMKTRVSNRRAENKLQIEAAQSEESENVYDKINDGELVGINALIDAQPNLTGKQKLDLKDSSAKRAKAINSNATTNRITEAELYTKSLDIWRGNISKAEFNKDLANAAENLDDDSYRRLAKSAADTLKSSQAESLSRANTEAGRLIVDFAEESAFLNFLSEGTEGMEVSAADIFKDEQNIIRQEQFFSLSQYNAEVRDWITENPDKLGKDFFQFSESLKHVYWNKSRQDIQRGIAEARARTLKSETPAEQGQIDAGKRTKGTQKTITATNPNTNERVQSTDGGKTWQPVP
jgi:hypothetical protein